MVKHSNKWIARPCGRCLPCKANNARPRWIWRVIGRNLSNKFSDLPRLHSFSVVAVGFSGIRALGIFAVGIVLDKSRIS